ncbi:hypothetical protein F442_01876 [Phytophthora nicotianae P10297]|uniref:Uncharacterized protein n=1 Tax=Phytophthora nicotianae P10297 TaxID=1317064 RepID=W3A3W7_PHYNI|nr:hypothetical protein F442_01876 [Phytophthora nicotianae P10297]
MSEQWLKERYKNWQRCWPPTGFPATNNQDETFKARLKETYATKAPEKGRSSTGAVGLLPRWLVVDVSI